MQSRKIRSELRRRRDLNPRSLSRRSLSRRVHSAALPRLQANESTRRRAPSVDGSVGVADLVVDAGEDLADYLELFGTE